MTQAIPKTLTIEIPSSAHVPEELQDPRTVRYLLAGALYTRGLVSGMEARSLTGDSRREFEETMSRLGFPLLSDDDETLAQEMNVEL